VKFSAKSNGTDKDFFWYDATLGYQWTFKRWQLNVQNQRERRTQTTETKTVHNVWKVREKLQRSVNTVRPNVHVVLYHNEVVLVIPKSVLVHTLVNVWELAKDLDEVGVRQRQHFDVSASSHNPLVCRFREHFSCPEHLTSVHHSIVRHRFFAIDYAYRAHHLHLRHYQCCLIN